MSIDSPTSSAIEKSDPLDGIAIGTVVACDDVKGLGRVQVELPGITKGTPKQSLPWYHCMHPVGLGGSTYSSKFSVPQVNTQVVVWFPKKDVKTGVVIGVIMNRVTFPDNKGNLASDYIMPTSSENHFTENWDKTDEGAAGQSHFSPDMSEDYPFSWGWVTPAMTWFKENMMKRTVEFVHNSFSKFKIFGNGNTVLHITGNFKLIVEKDFYIEVRGSKDTITFNDSYDHVIGNRVDATEKMHMSNVKGGRSLAGKEVSIN